MSRETALEQAAPGQIAYSDHVNPQGASDVLEVVHSSKRFWQDALELAGRAIKL